MANSNQKVIHGRWFYPTETSDDYVQCCPTQVIDGKTANPKLIMEYRKVVASSPYDVFSSSRTFELKPLTSVKEVWELMKDFYEEKSCNQ